jgi:hypothetical protein
MIMRGPAMRKTCTRVRIIRMVIVIRNLRKCIYLLARISCVGGQGTVPFATPPALDRTKRFSSCHSSAVSSSSMASSSSITTAVSTSTRRRRSRRSRSRRRGRRSRGRSGARRSRGRSGSRGWCSCCNSSVFLLFCAYVDNIFGIGLIFLVNVFLESPESTLKTRTLADVFCQS